MKAKILSFLSVFFLLFIMFFPLDFIGYLQKDVTSFLLGNLTKIITSLVFNKQDVKIDFSSDSLSMFVLMGILLVISILISFFIKSNYQLKVKIFIEELIVCYLIIILFKYGIDKIFKAQFYLPEPNILYSKFGNLDKDILFWSVMGTSRLYSILTGFVEVLAALLLMFKKTRIVGLLLSLIIFLNIIFINLGFDISVKLFSLILLLMSVFCLKDDLVKLYRFLILKKSEQLSEANLGKHNPFLVFMKTFVLGIAIIQILSPYFISTNFNDDDFQRQDLHGVYKILDEKSEIKYLFFHRKNYLILMNQNDEVIDFKYQKTSESSKIVLEDYQGNKELVKVHFRKSDGVLSFISRSLNIEAKQQNWKKMNALKPLFHWNIEASE